jgi:hypothetical protein
MSAGAAANGFSLGVMIISVIRNVSKRHDEMDPPHVTDGREFFLGAQTGPGCADARAG